MSKVIVPRKDFFCSSLIFNPVRNKYEDPSDIKWMKYPCYSLAKEEKVVCVIPTDRNLTYSSSDGKNSSRLISFLEGRFHQSAWKNLRYPIEVKNPQNLEHSEYAYSDFGNWPWTLVHVRWPEFDEVGAGKEIKSLEEAGQIVEKLVARISFDAHATGAQALIITNSSFSSFRIDDASCAPSDYELKKRIEFDYFITGSVVQAIMEFQKENPSNKLKIILR